MLPAPKDDLGDEAEGEDRAGGEGEVSAASAVAEKPKQASQSRSPFGAEPSRRVKHRPRLVKLRPRKRRRIQRGASAASAVAEAVEQEQESGDDDTASKQEQDSGDDLGAAPEGRVCAGGEGEASMVRTTWRRFSAVAEAVQQERDSGDDSSTYSSYSSRSEDSSPRRQASAKSPFDVREDVTRRGR